MNEKVLLFSIVIPAYNEEDALPACLKALKEQKGGFEYEIIVVDNDSQDSTAELARSLGVQVINEKRKGVGWARKTGTSAARGEFVLHVDADTRLPENYLEQVFERFGKDKKLVCLSGQMYFYDSVWWQNILRPFFHRILWLFAVLITRGRVGPMGNNMTFKKAIYEKTSGFDANLKYGEDMDLCKKLSSFGKVKLDMSLKCFASARRFKINKKLFEYFFNFIYMCFVGKSYSNTLPHSKQL